MSQQKVDFGLLEPGKVAPSVIVAMNVSFLFLEIVLGILCVLTNEIIVYSLLGLNFVLWCALNIMITNMHITSIKNK